MRRFKILLDFISDFITENLNNIHFYGKLFLMSDSKYQEYTKNQNLTLNNLFSDDEINDTDPESRLISTIDYLELVLFRLDYDTLKHQKQLEEAKEDLAKLRLIKEMAGIE